MRGSFATPAYVLNDTGRALLWRSPTPASQETFIINRSFTLLVLALALAVALTISACGDDGGDEDPQQVLEATFNNEAQIDSGVFDVSFDLTAEGGDNEGTLEASLGGPFESGDDGAVPKFEITAEADLESSAQDFSGSAGLVSAGHSAFVNFQDTDYEVQAKLFQQFESSFQQAAAQSKQQGEDGNFLSSIGVDPSNWLTDLSNEGKEDVEGTDTIHISGDADVPKLVEDIRTIAKRLPQAADQVTPGQLSQLDELTDIIQSAEFDIYTGADDDILRKLEANLEIDPPGTSGGPESVTVGFSLTLSELNEPQEIAGPTDAQPLGDLLQQFGVDPSRLGAAAAGGSGSGASGATNPATQAYLDCLADAQGQDALDQCAAL
ncbi:MAG: hypothetical protein ABWZ03_01040, partial [Solirubrobacterales bacterium]